MSGMRLNTLSFKLILPLLLLWSSVVAGAVAIADERPRPEWVWSSGERQVPQWVELSRSFEVPTALQSATIRLATDFASAQLSINGRPRLTLEDYGPIISRDITNSLHLGPNKLTFLCAGSPGPSAVCVEITLNFLDGTTQHIVSDGQWEGRQLATRADGSDAPAPTAVAVYGAVEKEFWGPGMLPAQITAFDNYEQWKQALTTSKTAVAPAIQVIDGFEVRLIRQAHATEGSWISLTFDPRGRAIVSMEERGLLRFTLDPQTKAVTRAEIIEQSLQEVRGLKFVGNDLYVNANASKGLFMLRDTTGDGNFNESRMIRSFTGTEGHGRNDLAVDPLGRLLSIQGDGTEIPTTGILDHTSPFRAARKGQTTSEGALIRLDPRSGRWEVIAAGMRNPFGVAVHPVTGDAFTFDADAEFDMGAPWYRANRILHLTNGRDFGWRSVTGTWPPYDPDRADNAGAAIDVGMGSPTGLEFGHRTKFPPQYRDALFALDWAYGRILAVHLHRRGASYTGESEVFLRGQPLNVTDIATGPDGALYFVTGGRKTQSGLYRISWVGKKDGTASPTLNVPNSTTDSTTISTTDPARSVQWQEREAYSKVQADNRQKIENILGNPSAPVFDSLWPYMGAADPAIRDAARVAVEHYPLATWSNRALLESNASVAVTALLAVARSGESRLSPAILRRLADFEYARLTLIDRHTMLRTIEICLNHQEQIDPAILEGTRKQLAEAVIVPDVESIAPVGMGGPLIATQVRLLIRLSDPSAVAKGMSWLEHARSQEDRLEALFSLRHAQIGWTIEQRTEYFRQLNELELSFQGGRGMPGFLKTIREEAVATLSSSERQTLSAIITPPVVQEEPLPPQRSLVQEWKLEELVPILARLEEPRNLDRGRELFRAALCSRCHRVGSYGAAVGPDLTVVASRFSTRDILEAIVEPSRAIAENYRNSEVLTNDGRLLVGQVITSGDYRSPTLRILTDPLHPKNAVEIPKSEVELSRESETSPMPLGLLNTLTEDEILDLIAFLRTGGRK